MASLQHTFRLGLRHPERTYRMEPGAVEWQDPRGRGRITYAAIDQIYLFKVRKFGVGGQTRALVSRCVLRARSGETITLAQDHYVRFGVREDRLRSFRLFTDVLVARVSSANPVLDRAFLHAMDFWTGVLDMSWHEVSSGDCAVELVDGAKSLFDTPGVAARSQYPDRAGFNRQSSGQNYPRKN